MNWKAISRRLIVAAALIWMLGSGLLLAFTKPNNSFIMYSNSGFWGYIALADLGTVLLFVAIAIFLIGVLVRALIPRTPQESQL